MPSATSDENAFDAERTRLETFSQVYLHGGWGRHLPATAIGILWPLVAGERATRDQLDHELSAMRDCRQGLASAAWEPLEEWTDDQLRQLRDEFPWPGQNESQSAAETVAAAAQHRAAQIAALNAHCDALGVARVRTMADLLELMVACRVVTRGEGGGEPWYELNTRAPLPAEILALTDRQRADEDDLRWRHLHDPTADRIIDLFQPQEPQRPDMLCTSLHRIARELDLDIESARAGLACLLRNADFTADRDPERLREYDVVEIRVAWEVFDRTRIFLMVADPSDRA